MWRVYALGPLGRAEVWAQETVADEARRLRL